MRTAKQPTKEQIMEEAFEWIRGYLSVTTFDAVKAVRCVYNYLCWCLLSADVCFTDSDVKDFIYERSRRDQAACSAVTGSRRPFAPSMR